MYLDDRRIRNFIRLLVETFEVTQDSKNVSVFHPWNHHAQTFFERGIIDTVEREDVAVIQVPPNDSFVVEFLVQEKYRQTQFQDEDARLTFHASGSCVLRKTRSLFKATSWPL